MLNKHFQKVLVGSVAFCAVALAFPAAVNAETCGSTKAHVHEAAMNKGNDYVKKTAKANIVETAVAAGDFTTLAALLQQSGLAETLQEEGPYTVFAPTDEAFKKVPAEQLEAIAGDKELLKRVLLHHVAKGKVKSGAVVELPKVRTLSGDFVEVKAYGEKVKLGGAKLKKADIYASNGVIHVIDTVLVPGPAPDKDIVETAVGAGQFNTLASLLTQAGLVDALKGEGPYTVFAPTDEAFAKVPEDKLNELASNPEKLKQVLLYHVVKGDVSSLDVAGIDKAETLAGKDVAFVTGDGAVKVNQANVVSADILTENGIIHVIDEVILPPS